MNKFKQILVIVTLLLLTLSACKTPQQRAERLVKRANAIYPIDSLVSERIVIDTLLKYDTVIVIKQDTLKVSVPIYTTVIDTVTKEKRYIPIIYKHTKVYDNEKAIIYLTSDKNGKLLFDVTVKQKEVRVQGEVKFKKTIITYRKYIHTNTNIRGVVYWIGWLAIGAVVIGIISFSIRRIKEVAPNIKFFKR